MSLLIKDAMATASENTTVGAYLLRDASGRFRFDLAADELGPIIAVVNESTVDDDRHMLRAGDRVKLIDGNDAFGLGLEEARALVKRAGPMIKLYVSREPGAPRVPPARTGLAGERQGAAGRRSADAAVSDAAELLARSKLAMQRPSMSAQGDALNFGKALEGFGTWLQTTAVDDARRAAEAAAEAVQQSARAVSETAAEAARRIAEASAEQSGGGGYSNGRFGGGGTSAGGFGGGSTVRYSDSCARGGSDFGKSGGGYAFGGIGSGDSSACGSGGHSSESRASGGTSANTGGGPTATPTAPFGPQCVCDMRGFKCPLHAGRELWRNRQDFAQAMAQGDKVPGEEAPVTAAAGASRAAAGSAVAGSEAGSDPSLTLIDLS